MFIGIITNLFYTTLYIMYICLSYFLFKNVISLNNIFMITYAMCAKSSVVYKEQSLTADINKE